MTQAWWEEMLVQWFDVPEEEKPAEEKVAKPQFRFLLDCQIESIAGDVRVRMPSVRRDD